MFNPVPIPFVAAATHTKAHEWIRTLQQAMPDEIIVQLSDMSAADRALCKVAIVANPNPADLTLLPQLQWIHSVWAGVERLVHDLGDSGLKIVRLVDPQLANTMAEAVLAWTLYLHRDMPAYARQQAQRRWQSRPYVRPGRKTVSLLGLGALGEAAAMRLIAAGFQVCGWSRNRRQVPNVECFSGEAELLKMLAKTDILVCLLPLTQDTHGLLNAERLAHLAPGASIINFARGPILVEQDLLLALEQKQLSHAVLDVFEVEPLPVESAIWQHPDITVLPHCAAPTDLETASRIVARNIANYRNSGIIPACVNLDRGY